MDSGRRLRLRGVVVAAACVLGYWAPWNRVLPLDGAGPNAHLWGVVSVWLTKVGVLGIGAAFAAVLGAGSGCAAAGAGLRTWASAGGGERAGYVGLVLHVVALALLMPLS
ncbi:MAG: isoprenylcysteine carboxylmethyltransferase family protein, partial [Acidobacteriota bacterium]|nr:isoprenylcysteine carboxylmethyltransferase family protein [Acidobacteriota bacterium]